MSKPFVNWEKKNEILPQHNEKLYHCKAVDLAKMFATGIENPTVRITATGNQMKLQNIEENRHILHTVAESVLYCSSTLYCFKRKSGNLEYNRKSREFFVPYEISR